MILVQNMVYITGIIGFFIVCCHSGLGNHLYLHRTFSYNRKKNLQEVYWLVVIETLCVSGGLCFLYVGLELGGLLEPMGISGLFVIVWMTFLANLICHGYAPMLHGIAALTTIFIAFFVSGLLFFIIWNGIQSNLYLTEIATALFVLNLCMCGIHVKLWKQADFM